MTAGRTWYTTAKRVYRGILEDNVTTVAASIAFFVLLAAFPALAAVVTLVSIFADPGRLESLAAAYPNLIPQGSVSVVTQQISRLTSADETQERVLNVTPFVGFGMLVWSTNKGTKALFRGLNVIFGCKESRGFIVFTLVTLGFTLGAIVFLLFSLGAVLIVPVVLKLLGLSEGHAHLLELLRWFVLFLVVSAVFSVIYRYGPSREVSEWRSILAGSSLAAVLWIGSSALLSWYVSSFDSFAALYGSLSAVIGFMVWIWLSSVAILVGAELDAALTQACASQSAAL